MPAVEYFFICSPRTADGVEVPRLNLEVVIQQGTGCALQSRQYQGRPSDGPMSRIISPEGMSRCPQLA
jgi:hypothetical protein